MTRELVEIQPTELKFIFELKKKSSCPVRLINTSNQYVAYKVKTTNPNRYCVRPNIGVISPNSPCEIIVTMEAPHSSQGDLQCKDKFLIQSTAVKEEKTMDQISSDLFVKEHGRIIEEKKLKVIFVSPPNSPIWQSRDIIKHPLWEVDSPVSQPSNIVQCQDSFLESHSPIKQPLHGVTTDQEVVYKARSRLSQFLDGARKPEPVCEAGSPVTQSLDIKERNEVVYEAHSPVLWPIDKEKPAFEATKPREKVLSFTEDSSSQPSQMILNDVEELRAKLNEAEKIIAHLREERSTFIQQQREAFQHELMLINRKRMAEAPKGYPFLFVCFTALVALVVGYILHS